MSRSYISLPLHLHRRVVEMLYLLISEAVALLFRSFPQVRKSDTLTSENKPWYLPFISFGIHPALRDDTYSKPLENRLVFFGVSFGRSECYVADSKLYATYSLQLCNSTSTVVWLAGDTTCYFGMTSVYYKARGLEVELQRKIIKLTHNGKVGSVCPS